MNREEKIVQEALIAKGYKTIRHEPDGNIPPDFSIDNIGIEVRRLNQYVESSNKAPRAIEGLYYKLIPRIRKILEESRRNEVGDSYFLMIEFSRPLNINKRLFQDIRSFLQFEDEPEIGKVYHIRDHLSIELFKSSDFYHQKFLIGTIQDADSGGFVLRNILSSLELIIPEKEAKVRPYHDRYNQWWLILVDYIGYGIRIDEIEQVRRLIKYRGSFEKIVIVSLLDNGSSWVEV